MKKNDKNLKFFFIVGIMLVLVPLILYFSFPKLNAESWMGFLGGYLGAIIGVLGVVFGIKFQLDSDKQARNDDKIDNTFFNLLSTLQNISDNLESSGIFQALYEKLHEDLLFDAKKIVNNKISENIEWILKERTEIIHDLENDIIPKLEKNIPDADVAKHMYRMQRDSDRIENKELELLITFEEIHDLLQSRDYELKNYFKDLEKFLRILEQMNKYYLMTNETKNGKNLKKFTEFLNNYFENKLSVIPSNKRIESITRTYNKTNKTYPFLSLLQEILSYLNVNVSDRNIKDNYVGFLRSILNENSMLVVTYYSIYSNQGEKLKTELVLSNFFGYIGELFEYNSSKLFWGEEDNERISKIASSLNGQ